MSITRGRSRAKPKPKRSRRKKAEPKRPPLSRQEVDAIFNLCAPAFGPLFGGSQVHEEAESGHDPIRQVSIHEIEPSPENNELYRPVDPADPEIMALADSIKQNGVLEPIIITADDYVVSGHRRLAACKLAGLAVVPCRVLCIRRTDDTDAFVRLLREHNRQRDKTRAEKLREEIVSINPDEAHEALVEYRREQAAIDVVPLTIRKGRRRARITIAKAAHLAAIKQVVERSKYPPSVRAIHYALLNDPPLIHASKPDSRYQNNHESYRATIDLACRARICGEIPMNAITDETRPVALWDVHDDPRSFIRQEIRGLLKGYWRNLQQSQHNHLELLCEKNTVVPIVRPIAAEYCAPLTSGRGFCSVPPRAAMAKRFQKSGKEKLVLLIVSDFDPDGDEIAHSFARSMRDDFGIDNIHAIKAALTAGQVAERNLPQDAEAKKSSTNYKRFVAKYGEAVHELEALQADDLQTIVRQAIESVIDRDAYAAEIAAEREDAAHLAAIRQTVLGALKEMDLDFDGEE